MSTAARAVKVVKPGQLAYVAFCGCDVSTEVPPPC